MILLAGVMNFINLYLVLMVKRGKVYSLRKVFGADRKALFKQIFIENFLLIAASMIVAWLIVEVTNIPVSSMFGSQLMYTAFDGILSFSILLFLPLLVSIYAFVQCQRSLLAVSIRKVGTDNHSVRLYDYFPVSGIINLFQQATEFYVTYRSWFSCRVCNSSKLDI